MSKRWPAALGLLVLLLGPGVAQAETIGFAEAYDRIAKACGRDVEKHCGNVMLGGGKIRACIEQKPVSAECKAVAAQSFALLDARIKAQASAAQVCERDRLQFCRGVQPHDGYQLQCLLKASKVVSQSCAQVITDAGWR